MDEGSDPGPRGPGKPFGHLVLAVDPVLAGRPGIGKTGEPKSGREAEDGLRVRAVILSTFRMSA